MLTKTPLVPEPPPFCRLLASEVRKLCNCAVVLLDDPEPDELDPSAVSRFWKSVVRLLLEASLDEEPDDVLPEPEVSDCARLSSADARPPP